MIPGLIPLGILAAVALFLTITRATGDRDSEARARLQVVVALAIGVQLVHFLEELSQHFEQRFPDLLGLSPWPVTFFVSFNVFWLVAWVLSAVGLCWNARAALFPLWFLGLGCALNAVAHPLLALAEGRYFPGLWTSPLSGVVGVLLLRRLALFTRARGRESHSASSNTQSRMVSR